MKMNPSDKSRCCGSRRVIAAGLFAVALPLLASCSTHIRFPWEADPLDPSRVETREPLEVPPDLWVLPQPGDEELDTVRSRKKEATQYESADAILFGASQAIDPAPLDRDKKEILPGWMDAPPAK